MINRRAALLLPLGLLPLAACETTPAAPPPAPTPPPQAAVVSDEVTMRAIVETVDRTKREVLLRGQDGAQTGALITVRVGNQVRNFNQIRSGDRVTVTYLRAVAAAIAPATGTGTRPAAAIAGVRAAPGQRPAGAVGDIVRTRVRITEVDTATNSVTFVGPNNRPRTVHVRQPAMQELLRTLKPGDQVDIAFEEALAVTVEKTPQSN
jgi:hypothetical protein